MKNGLWREKLNCAGRVCPALPSKTRTLDGEACVLRQWGVGPVGAFLEMGRVAGSDEDGAIAEAGADIAHQAFVTGHSGRKLSRGIVTGEEDVVGHTV